MHPPVSTVKVLLDHQEFTFGTGKTAGEKKAAKEAYHTDPELYFKRPDASEAVPFRKYFEGWMIRKRAPKRVEVHRDYTVVVSGEAAGNHVYKRANPGAHLLFIMTARTQTRSSSRASCCCSRTAARARGSNCVPSTATC